jgi:hypothetical protein
VLGVADVALTCEADIAFEERADLGATRREAQLGRAMVIGGRGKRRIDADLDHVVDNFSFGYELRMNLNVDAKITGCRIGYEPPAP